MRCGDLPKREDDPAVLLADLTRLREEVKFTAQVWWKHGIARFAASHNP